MSHVPSIFAAPPSGGNDTNNNYTSNTGVVGNTKSYGSSPPTTQATAITANTYDPTTATANTAVATPATAGLPHNLPQHVADAANLHGVPVIAWTCFDPAFTEELGRFVCFRAGLGPLLLPCFWIHLCILWPCLTAQFVAVKNATLSQYWIVTSTDLKIVSLDHDACCCPGMCKTGHVVKTVPLEQITDCGKDNAGTGAVNKWTGDMPSVYVNTASGREAVGLGLENYDWFIQQVLNQRNIVKGTAPGGAAMARPGASNKSAQERLAEITQLQQQGIITQAEFDKKRQEIVASI